LTPTHFDTSLARVAGIRQWMTRSPDRRVDALCMTLYFARKKVLRRSRMVALSLGARAICQANLYSRAVFRAYARTSRL